MATTSPERAVLANPAPAANGTGATGPIPDAVLAEALFHALGYVAAWRGRTVVVKLGGSALEAGGPGTLAADLVALSRAGVRPVLVHGGGPEITRMLERLGQPTAFVDGLRVTDAATIEVVEMVLAGRVNKQLVVDLQQAGGEAVGLSGVDGGLLAARPHPAGPALGFVGEVAAVRPGVVERLLDAGVIPVVATLGLGEAGQRYNLNADTAAAALAVALRADKLIFLTDVPGIFRPADDGPRLLPELDADSAGSLLADGTLSGGMIPKVAACLAALSGGVASAHIVGSTVPHGLLVELFTDEGSGTMFRPAPNGGPPWTP